MTIYLENIYKAFDGIQVLNDFNVNIEDGKCYAFIGQEGTGKSTVLKIFMGTEKPDSGKVSRMGDYKYPTLHTAYVPQEDDFNPKKNAVWNVRKAHRSISKGSAAGELARFLSEDKMRCPVGELSDRERRMVQIVRAMLIPADFIVLDEPFKDMSPDERSRVLDYVLNKLGTRPLLLAQRTEPDSKAFRIINMDNK